ncbi:MAG: type II toxin-antitoxin system VapC family toxin [Candidatus Eremiobacteraeota bacterium]|nr:type II toxin-antitoxin system VapC family toxin [Candidatus Eremiobacteraeota bacterium]MCW5865979.1 type II toxin-antitoxin system VapC family toxin [Candidatus Eremiobacteraeota bacterium]
MELILLDTCTFLWLADSKKSLPPAVKDALRASGERYVSAISAFEIGYKNAQGKLDLPSAPAVWFQDSCAARGIRTLPISDAIAMRASQLPMHHRDPADRFIIATALEYDARVLTPDPYFLPYGVKLLWDGLPQ